MKTVFVATLDGYVLKVRRKFGQVFPVCPRFEDLKRQLPQSPAPPPKGGPERMETVFFATSGGYVESRKRARMV